MRDGKRNHQPSAEPKRHLFLLTRSLTRPSGVSRGCFVIVGQHFTCLRVLKANKE